MSLYIDINKELSSFNLDVSMESKGGIIGFLGASGSGKSMTLKCIAGIEKADSGKIIINYTNNDDLERILGLIKHD